VIPFEVLPSIECRSLLGLSLYSEWPIERLVADALVHLAMSRSENWKKAMRLKPDEAVGIEISLEELGMILERVDFHSGARKDIEAINFWPHLLAAMEFLETIGFKWETNEYGFDRHDSYAVRWFVPEGLVGYLTWLLREGRSGADIPAELRYRDFHQKRARLTERLTAALAEHVDSRTACNVQNHSIPARTPY
jgi:hypothetical protein